MKTWILATKNPGKIREVKEIFPEVHIMTMKEAGLDPEIIEDGTTFEANALIKARAVHKALGSNPEGCDVIADDSGIEIDYLDKAPGVYSARYLGEDTPYSYKNQVILDKLKDAVGSERTARYVAAIAVVLADGTEMVLRDTVEGEIALKPAGEGGFGYDPIFYVPEFGKNMAELTPDEKNSISHRGKALRRMRECLISGKYW